MITGFWISQAIYAAAKLGIADLVKEGPKPCEELAQATGMHPQALYRLLRALASVGVFREGADGRFGLTPLAAYLQTGVPDSLRAFALMQSEVESQGRLLGVGSLDGWCGESRRPRDQARLRTAKHARARGRSCIDAGTGSRGTTARPCGTPA